MLHRGEIVEEAVRQSGLSLTVIAKRLGKSRRHLYNLFEDPHLSLDTILQIGKIIRCDFTLNSSLFPLSGRSEAFNPETPLYWNGANETPDYWKNKYLHLLEKYNKLLEERLGN
jgi:hypothetical protein